MARWHLLFPLLRRRGARLAEGTVRRPLRGRMKPKPEARRSCPLMKSPATRASVHARVHRPHHTAGAHRQDPGDLVHDPANRFNCFVGVACRLRAWPPVDWHTKGRHWQPSSFRSVGRRNLRQVRPPGVPRRQLRVNCHTRAAKSRSRSRTNCQRHAARRLPLESPRSTGASSTQASRRRC